MRETGKKRVLLPSLSPALSRSLARFLTRHGPVTKVVGQHKVYGGFFINVKV